MDSQVGQARPVKREVILRDLARFGETAPLLGHKLRPPGLVSIREDVDVVIGELGAEEPTLHVGEAVSGQDKVLVHQPICRSFFACGARSGAFDFKADPATDGHRRGRGAA